jgi:hypothetical protein
MWNVWGRGKVHTGFWLGNLRKREQLENPGVDGRIILSWIFRKWDMGAWTSSMWLRIGTVLRARVECGNEHYVP